MHGAASCSILRVSLPYPGVKLPHCPIFSRGPEVEGVHRLSLDILQGEGPVTSVTEEGQIYPQGEDWLLYGNRPRNPQSKP